MGINLTKLIQNTGTQSVLQKATGQNPLPALKINTGILDKDTATFSQKAGKKAVLPFVDKTTQAEAHHDINGSNCLIRGLLNKVEQGKDLSRAERGYFEVINEIDEQFEKLPPLEDDFVFYRGRVKHPVSDSLNQDFYTIEGANVGDIIVPDKAYSYAAFKKDLANGFTSSNKETGMMMEIHTPKGAKVSRSLEYGGEVIFPRGAQYRLISREKDENGFLNVVLEYILPEK